MPPRPRIPKLTKPVLARVCRRPRLFRRLDALGRRHRVVWLGAAGGSGKTTLAASYLAARRRSCLWYQLDARDADPAAFFYYLREAAGQLSRRRRETLPLLTPEYALGLDAYARLFFERLGALLPAGTWIVLDDYQDLPDGAPLHALLPGAFAALPGSARVLVLSRSAPPPSCARLVTNGTIGFLDAEELGLTAGETLALARVRVGARVGHGAAAALRATTGGWVAGTVLLLETNRALPPRRGFETPARQVLFDYFAAEILERASPQAQRLLLSAALLPEIDVAAAEALAGEPRAADVLADLVRRNFFTVRLEGTRPRYRLHPLFREFLLARARRSFEPAAWAALARRAAELLAAAGDADGAAAVLMDAGRAEELAGLLCAHAPALAGQGRLASIDAWVGALPPALVESSPWVSYWAGMCRLARPAEARRHLERAYRAFRSAGDRTGQLVSWAGYVNTFLFVWDDFTPLDPWIEELERLRAEAPEYPSLDIEVQVTFGMLATLTWRAPAHPSLDEWVGRATALLDSGVRTELRVQLAAYLIFYWSMRGDLAATAGVVEKLRALVHSREVTPLTQAFWCAAEAGQRARWGDHGACLASVERGLELVRRTGVVAVHGLLAMQGVYGGLVAGDVAVARRYHALAREHHGTAGKVNAIHHQQLGAWIALAAGDVAAAAREVRSALALARESGLELAIAWNEHTLAHVLVEEGDVEGAVALLERCIDWARRVRDRAVLHHALLSIAYARLASRRAAEALPFLRDGMRVGREEGYLVPAWISWRKDVMARLAALALEHDIEPEHTRALVRTLRLARPESAAGLAAWPAPVRIDALGGLEVWRDGARVEFRPKTPRKPLELLRLLVAHGERGATLDGLAEALWPDADGDTAHHALETTLYRLRRLLGDPAAVVRRGGRAALDAERVFVDAWAVEALAARAEALGRRGQHAEAARAAAAAADLCRGDLLPECDLPGVDRARARLRGQLERLVARRAG